MKVIKFFLPVLIAFLASSCGIETVKNTNKKEQVEDRKSTYKEMQADFVIQNINIVPMNEEAVLNDRALVVKDGKIAAIVESAQADDISTPVRINGQGKFIMPGLADMHVHMRMPPQALLNILLANGVTTMAHMRLADGDGHVQRREDITAGKVIGPRYIVGGPMLAPYSLKSVPDVEPMLDRHIEEKYDFIKIHEDLPEEIYSLLIKGAKERGLRVTGHMQRAAPLERSFSMTSIEHMEEFLYVTEEGLSSLSADGAEKDELKRFVEAYLSNIKLLSTPSHREKLSKLVADSGLYITPTLVIYESIGLYLDDEAFSEYQNSPLNIYLPEEKQKNYLDPENNQYRKNMRTFFGPLIGLNSNEEIAKHFEETMALLKLTTKSMLEAGVPMLLGADAFGSVIPGFSIHRELELLVESGLSPFEAISTGTVNVARYLGESEIGGTLEVGKKADFVVLEGNPLSDIQNTVKIQGVFTHEKWHSKTDLARFKVEAAGLVEQKNLADRARASKE